LAGERHYAKDYIETCKAACGETITLKVILETGALNDPALIADACFDVFSVGADFVKTSTGKISEGATLEAAATMLLVIKHMQPQVKHTLGLKVSGGIREVQQAAQYVELADAILGRDWVTPQTFRIGASKLIDALVMLSG
jgi:deoxyribose-phosphate aldolase